MEPSRPWLTVSKLVLVLGVSAWVGCNSKLTVDDLQDAGGDGGSDGGIIPPSCNNGTLDPGEACDDGNNVAADGCSPDCSAVDPNWTCPTPGSSCVKTPVCGDGFHDLGEPCDDHAMVDGDGCSATCTVEAGWNCSTGFCQAALCGDGIVAGAEECEDNNATPAGGDGCSANCKLEDGFKCPTPGAACIATNCGDHITEGTEQCDDGNKNTGDGCSPSCRFEPVCSNGTCTPVCGDGVILPNDTTEECDDGNLKNGDGCSSLCKKEPNFTCTLITQDPPDHVDLPVVYRDFLGWDLTAQTAKHVDFENKNGAESDLLGCAAVKSTGQLTWTSNTCSPLVQLDADGKPVLVKASPSTVSSVTSFGQWYRSDDAVNRTVVDKLTMTRCTGVDQPIVGCVQVGSYVFANTAFFPLDTRGWVAAGNESLRSGHNFHFTSETRYWFEYKGTEVLDFYGDDDVFVFINKRLAVDIGGVHGPRSGRITVADRATDFGLTLGGIYEAAVFQAERHVTGSQYMLTLTNFESRRTECVPNFVCGDGTVQAPNEQCDNGTANNTGGYGKCSPGCLLGPRCGDGVTQAANGEACDDNNTTSGDGCSATCAVEIN